MTAISTVVNNAAGEQTTGRDSLAERYAKKTRVSDTHGIYIQMPDGSTVWSPCVDWTGARDDEGYGNFWVDGHVVKAHRVGYYLRTGKYPPKDRVLDHLCSRHGCQEHTQAVTQFENVRRGQSPIGYVMRERDNKYTMTVIAYPAMTDTGTYEYEGITE